MGALTNKVRLYDLAKDLKIDTKRLIEEVRREGVDVSVPSNSVSKELADKIREKYFPQKDTAVKRAIRVVKKAARPVVEEAPPAETQEIAAAPEPAQPEPTDVAETAIPAQATPTRVIRKLSPAARAAKPIATSPATATPEQTETESELAASASEDGAAAAAQSEPVQIPSRQVRVMRPTAAALSAGVRPGERAPAPPPTAPTVRERSRDRSGRARVEYAGTPGETPTPQTTYIPPPDAGRRRSRRGSSRMGKRTDGKGSRFDKEFIPPPKPLSLEERVAGRLEATVPGELKPVRLVEGSTVKEFAEKLGIKPKDVVALLLQRGVFATINQALNDDVAAEFGQRFGYDVSFVPFEEMVAEEEFEELIAADADDVEVPRAPVVTVMGHVDHGKTSLLDAIRTTNVVAGEAGGITQHIGAYSVEVQSPDNPNEKRRVVFLDTPGHEAFTLMRARGAKATDVVVLVVAADDGVMPQTIEAIEHSRAANVPIVVAINKIDKPDANPDRVRQELSQQGLNPVEWGGETEVVQVSAKKRENIEHLLETILLTSDILNLRASTTRLASGVVLEAKLDRGRGSVATALVQQGTLRVGDPFIVGQIFGKVRAMFNDRGEPVAEAGPATPVEVLGLQGVPQAGESFQVVADVGRAQQISGHRQAAERQRTLIKTTKRGIEALGETEVKELLVVLKADVQGSVEVLKSTLQKMSTERVKVKVVRSGVGAITESDVLLASATQAGSASTAVVIIGFNVRPESRAGDLAKQESVDIRLHSIIYKVEEEIKAAMIGMLEKIEKEKILGKADVREVFKVPKVGAVAGCMVIDGIMKRNARARLIRDAVVIWEGNIGSLRRFKDDASEVREGFECGIGLENFNDIKV
ncbi:MAG TPA: translation initiation factor IF-2, partial [Pyrinomonadaceae bacterium]|nr:translation initiation factor IF-2 [Pyrinomonadaceae bacterium]